MPSEKDSSLDVLGAKAFGEAVKVVASKGTTSALKILEKICLPAAEEFGFLLREKVGGWRASNAEKIAEKAQAKLSKYNRDNVHGHPRLVMQVIENGSWIDDNVIQSAWAGILASSCTENGTDDSNVIFVTLLNRMTGVGIRILNHAVENCDKFISKTGLPYAGKVVMSLAKLEEVTGCDDVERLDIELDNLRSLDLIGGGMDAVGGFYVGADIVEAEFIVTVQALHLYVRGQGFVGTLTEYFDLKEQAEPSGRELRKAKRI